MKKLILEKQSTSSRLIYCLDPNKFVSTLKLFDKTRWPRRYISKVVKKYGAKCGIEWIKRRLIDGRITALIIKFSQTLVPLTILKHPFSPPFVWCQHETYISRILGFIHNLISDIKEHSVTITQLSDWVNKHYTNCACAGKWLIDFYDRPNPGIELICDGTLIFKVSSKHTPGKSEMRIEAKDFVLYIHSMRIGVNAKI